MLHAPATSASLSVSALLLYSYALLAWPPKRSGRSGRSGSLAPRSHSASFNRRRPHACSAGRGPCDSPATARVPLGTTAAASLLSLVAARRRSFPRPLAGRIVAARLPSPIERPLSLSLCAGHRASCATLSRRTLIAFALAAAMPPCVDTLLHSPPLPPFPSLWVGSGASCDCAISLSSHSAALHTSADGHRQPSDVSECHSHA
ncbi:hypothetical protein L1887_55961 [Cichorium endivia]|nr:hypothetical protein L1887_55961 [Cichorium endivia]